MRTFRLFVSSPGDAAVERQRTESVVSRMNGEFGGLARIDTIRWETEYYRAHETFQTQIPEAAECDIVVGILRWRLGAELPPEFPNRLPSGDPYPSGTAYEILSAVERRKAGAPLPDVFVFRYAGGAPQVVIGQKDEDAVRRGWAALQTFFARWFITPAGHFLAALNSYASEDQFERQLDDLLRKWITQQVGDRAISWPASKGSPFRHLDAFGAKHAPVFFGRGAEIRKATELWRQSAEQSTGAACLFILGGSGVGKSSLARAGLIPRITTAGVVPGVDLWRVAVMRPVTGSSEGPFAALAAALLQSEATLPPEDEGRGPALPEIAEGDSETTVELAALLTHADASAVKPILKALMVVGEQAKKRHRYGRPVRCDLVLLVDQLEELFATSVTDEARINFAKLLAALVATRRVWLAATLRDDLYGSLLQLQPLKALKEAGASYDLTSPGAIELAEIVREPATAAGVDFELDSATGERLDERLLREVDPDMLPLAQLALGKLWDARESRNGTTVLSNGAFAHLGGVRGIIASEGERALERLTELEKAQLAPLIRRLAELTQGRLTARAVPLVEAAPGTSAKKLVFALVEARLLTIVREGEVKLVRLPHQRVLADWPRAATIVKDSQAFYRIRDEIETQRHRWAASGKRGELLLARGLPLFEARKVATSYKLELSPETHAFVKASRRRANRALTFGWILAAVFALVAIYAIFEAKIASDQTARAELSLASSKMIVESIISNIASKIADVAIVNANTAAAIILPIDAAIDQLQKMSPNDIQIMHMKSLMHCSSSTILRRLGHFNEALNAAHQCVDLTSELIRLSSSPQFKGEAIFALDVLAATQFLTNDHRGAVETINKAILMARKSIRGESDFQGKTSLANLLYEHATMTGDDSDTRGMATESLNESISILRKILQSEKDDRLTSFNLSQSLILLGTLYSTYGEVTKAIAPLEEARTILIALRTINPDSVEYKNAVYGVFLSLADARIKLDALDLNIESMFLAAYFQAKELAAMNPTGWSENLKMVEVSIKIIDFQLEYGLMYDGNTLSVKSAYSNVMPYLRVAQAIYPKTAFWKWNLFVYLEHLARVRGQYRDKLLDDAGSLCKDLKATNQLPEQGKDCAEFIEKQKLKE